MKKEKRLSKADGLRVLIGAYDAIEYRRELTMCAAITETANKLGLVDRKKVLAYELIPELRMFKPINSRIEEIWFNLSDKDTRLYILHTLINIYNDTDHPNIVEKIARKIRSIF